MHAMRTALAGALLAVCSAPALAGTVTVITSFPKDLTQAYKSAFEKANPGITLEILNKNTVSGIAYVRETPAGQRPEVFWASAPDAFEVLNRDKLLAKSSDVANKDVPDKIGNYPINDPSGMYLGQALAGYGIVYNTRYIAAHKIPAPVEWKDLLSPKWFGHVGITSPSRSGTMHLTVETILQGEGWDDGWNTLLRMSGNSSAVTERSFGVPDGVQQVFQVPGGIRLPVRNRHRAGQHCVDRRRQEHRRRQEVHRLHAEPGGPGIAAGTEDLASAGAALLGAGRQDSAGLPGPG
jgi:phosphoglycerate transport regulatory protein PgtC